MRLYDQDGNEISDWRNWTPPKEDYQWKAGRSSMELARSWFTAPRPVVPPEVRALLESYPDTRGAELTEGWPEWVTPLPEKGEGRNHDLVAIGRAGTRKLLLAVEGKVDEPLGEPIGAYWQKSKDNRKSKAWKRIDTLLTAAFGTGATASMAPWSALRYQLLTALVGTALEAKQRSCDIAVLCIHEFVTEAADARKLKVNHDAIAAFLKALGSRPLKSGVLAGPFVVRLPESNHAMPVLIGKAEYRWKARKGSQLPTGARNRGTRYLD